MIQRFLNFKTILAVIAITVVCGTIFYSNYLAKKIAFEERLKINNWAEATRTNNDTSLNTINDFAFKVVRDSMEIPVLYVTEKNEIIDLKNIDTVGINNKKEFVEKTIQKFSSIHEPIVVWKDTINKHSNVVYYGESKLLNQVRYFPLVQLLIAILFVVVVVLALQSNYKSTQNQVWAGLAKETAHQLGTPVSSLEGWVEVLKENREHEKIAIEIEKDVQRLQLITDRFGKIGSTPQLEEKDIVLQVQLMMDYIKKRAGQKVIFKLNSNHETINAKISPPLFDWVIENLLKNALDAMEGKGSIAVNINVTESLVIIEVADTGKGISAANLAKVFKPGFTTKKRGWGLGLTLTKRIVEQYHKGIIFVKNSELNKGTTFRIELKQV